MMKPQRTILRTVDGLIVVRPASTDYIESDDGMLIRHLSNRGKIQWARSEELSGERGSFRFSINRRVLDLSEAT